MAGIEKVVVAADPLAPLVFRTGRSFGESGESGADVSFDFPRPATFAGALRASVADTAKLDMTVDSNHALLFENVTIRGPFLACAPRGQAAISCMYFPKPADALYLLEQSGGCRCHSLRPAPHLQAAARLPYGLLPLSEAGPAEPDPAPQKPANGPQFWDGSTLRHWLVHGEFYGDVASNVEIGGKLCDGPPRALRTHLQLDYGKRAAREGHLYQSAGLDFCAPARDGKWADDRYLLVGELECSLSAGTTPFNKRLDRLPYRLGADGRGVRLRTQKPLGSLTAEFDGAYFETIEEAVLQSKRFRLVLVTPGLFEGGAWPGWLRPDEQGRLQGELPGTGCTVRLTAASVARWEPHSGWSMQHHREKAIRRVVPAGAVYWFETIKVADEAHARVALNDWVFRAIGGNNEVDRDGWGLSLLGVAQEIDS